jgi:hypothetical protein
MFCQITLPDKRVLKTNMYKFIGGVQYNIMCSLSLNEHCLEWSAVLPANCQQQSRETQARCRVAAGATPGRVTCVKGEH